MEYLVVFFQFCDFDQKFIQNFVAASLWTVMTLGMSKPQDAPTDAPASDTLIASLSLLLILVLVNHCTNDEHLYNPYRDAVVSFTNASGVS